MNCYLLLAQLLFVSTLLKKLGLVGKIVSSSASLAACSTLIYVVSLTFQDNAQLLLDSGSNLSILFSSWLTHVIFFYSFLVAFTSKLIRLSN